MPHLEGVEEGIEAAEELVDSNSGDQIDPTNEQDNADCEEEELLDHPDYLARDPTDFLEKPEASTSRSMYKKIEIYDDEKLQEMTLRLDEEQRRVVEIGVNYAKNLVKSQKNKDCVTGDKLPLLVIQGEAGTGKSAVIDVLAQRMEKILQKVGEHPNKPRVIVSAPTGMAFTLIDGITIDSALNLKFGASELMLSEQKVAQFRNELEDLKALICDEFSLLGADKLFKIHHRLKQVCQTPITTLFGEIAVVLVGDEMQIPLVKASYVFLEPRTKQYKEFNEVV